MRVNVVTECAYVEGRLASHAWLPQSEGVTLTVGPGHFPCHSTSVFPVLALNLKPTRAGHKLTRTSPFRQTVTWAYGDCDSTAQSLAPVVNILGAGFEA